MADRKQKKEKGGAPEYMLTYGDMVTLLLTFFVLMFTVGEADPREMRLILSAFTGSMGMFEGGKTLSKGQLAEMGMTIESLPSKQKGSNLARSKKDAQEILKPELRAKKIRIREDERGITISLASDVYFAPGSTKLQINKAGPILRKIAQLIKRLGNKQIRIEGHTDNTPVGAGQKYKNNWELSTLRAINVLNFLLQEGVPEKQMEVSGFAQYKPIKGANNATPEGRAYNRRVDIVILRQQ